MSLKKPSTTTDSSDRLIADVRRSRKLREQEYREQALGLYPHLCARCGREFSGKKLRELTVHHKDHDHENNPPDGSNWELLCLYCHDHEHQRYLDQDSSAGPASSPGSGVSSTYRPFAALDALLKEKKGGRS
jgi:5-methylcytosine-specific restriction endonuclease McrA